jgi:hypothetical protein
MKEKIRCIVCTLFLVLSAGNIMAATISGHVTGNTEKQLNVFYPFNGFTTVWFLLQEKSLVDLDTSNNFTVRLSINRPGFITLYIDYNPVDLFVDDSSDLFIEIHLDSIKGVSHKNWLGIKGKYAPGNLYFNEYNFYPHTKYAGVIDFFSQVDKFELSYLRKSIDSLVNEETGHFDSLLHNKDIDSSFWNIVSKNIQSLLYHEIIRHALTDFDKREIMSASAIASLLNWMFTKCNPLDPDLLYGVQSTLYTTYFFLVKELQKENKRLYQNLTDSVINSNGSHFVIASSYKHLAQISDKRLQENAWAEELFSYRTILNGAVTNNDIEVFKFYFPHSKWLPFLK